jgi:thiamine biosynthesis lipoprotein ApbE
MNSSRLALKRARPALGTILLLRLSAPGGASEAAIELVLAQAFELCEDLENKFSKFREGSDVSRLNLASVNREIPVSREFVTLMERAVAIWRASEGAFNPFAGQDLLRGPDPILMTGTYAQKTVALQLDLSGIAKGFIVDQVTAFIGQQLPEVEGTINAGGDLRFLNCDSRQAQIRIAGDSSRARTLSVTQNALATSALNEWLENPMSSTNYPSAPRLDKDCSVSVVAADCAIADALTKVGWFAEPHQIANCAKRFGAEILIFDARGELTESFT